MRTPPHQRICCTVCTTGEADVREASLSDTPDYSVVDPLHANSLPEEQGPQSPHFHQEKNPGITLISLGPTLRITRLRTRTKRCKETW